MEKQDFINADHRLEARHIADPANSPYVALIDAIRVAARHGKKVRYELLSQQMRPLLEIHGYPLSADDREANENVQIHLNEIRRGNRPNERPAYLHWLWLHHRTTANALLRRYGISGPTLWGKVSYNWRIITASMRGWLGVGAGRYLLLGAAATALAAWGVVLAWNGGPDGDTSKKKVVKEAPPKAVSVTGTARNPQPKRLDPVDEPKPPVQTAEVGKPVSKPVKLEPEIIEDKPTAKKPVVPKTEEVNDVVKPVVVEITAGDIERVLRMKQGKLVNIMASGQPNFAVTIFLELSADQAASIRKVYYSISHYKGANAWRNPHVGGKAGSGFPASWNQWGCAADGGTIVVTLTDDRTVTVPFDHCQLTRQGRLSVAGA